MYRLPRHDMKETGIIRKIDALGRIVIPKEIRKHLRIRNGDDLEMFTESERLVLQKYSAAGSMREEAQRFAELLSYTLNMQCFLCDTERIVAGAREGELLSAAFLKVMRGAQVQHLTGAAQVPLVAGDDVKRYAGMVIAPAAAQGEIFGAVAAVSKKDDTVFKPEDILLLKHTALLFASLLA